MNLRKSSYFALMNLRGFKLGAYYQRFWREDHEGIPSETTKTRLLRMLAHCKQFVPYYASIMRDRGNDFLANPETYLQTFPILTKDTIRDRYEELKSADLPTRKWYLNSSGGSTGTPVQLIQDYEYAAQSGAIKILFAKLAGREIGESEVRLWGSARDIRRDTDGWRARSLNWLTHTTFLNSGLMTPERMRAFIAILNAKRPKLIVAYAEAIYELAKYAQRAGLEVLPQEAILTSAGTLFPFMRGKIEAVFQCKVYDKYGSREVGDIACERPGRAGLWVAPWGNYLEIVDDKGHLVPAGCEGEILVTSLTNYAMPLIRYRIGDRGILAPDSVSNRYGHGQVLSGILGRSMDFFRHKDGFLVNAGYFMALLYYRDWISRYQVIQRNHSLVVYKIVKSLPDPQLEELDEIVAKTKVAMGDDCEVVFEFVDEIPACASGKYRFLISEVLA
jgi:phenylacetate-CoA ligase